MRLKPATATLGKKLNPDLDSQEQDLSFVTLLPVEPIPEPTSKQRPPAGRHSRNNSFEFEFSGSTAKPDQEIIFCGRILNTGGISSLSSSYNYDSDGGNNRERRVHSCADDHCLYDSPAVKTTPSTRSLLMGQGAAGRSKSFNFRHQQQQQTAPLSKPKLGPSKSLAYSSLRGSVGGFAKVSPKVVATEGKKVAVGEGGEIVAGGGGGLGRSRSFRKSVSFSRCFPIASASARHDFY